MWWFGCSCCVYCMVGLLFAWVCYLVEVGWCCFVVGGLVGCIAMRFGFGCWGVVLLFCSSLSLWFMLVVGCGCGWLASFFCVVVLWFDGLLWVCGGVGLLVLVVWVCGFALV